MTKEDNNSSKGFQIEEEPVIVALALNNPTFFSNIVHLFRPEMFDDPACRKIITVIRKAAEELGFIPDSNLLKARIKKSVTVRDDHKPIRALLSRALTPREFASIKPDLQQWAQKKHLELLYTPSTVEAWKAGDFEKIRKIVEDASKISITPTEGVWFFDRLDDVFRADRTKPMPIGFQKLDQAMGTGGPSKKQVLTLVGPTNSGKSLIMCNIGKNLVKDGWSVLHLTLEDTMDMVQKNYAYTMSDHTRKDFVAASTKDDEIPTPDQLKKRTDIIRNLNAIAKNKGKLHIQEHAGDDTSMETVRVVVEELKKTKAWTPDVIIIDYMELMQASGRRNADTENKEYLRQKRVGTEMLSFAKRENVLIITATQGNRQSLAAPEDTKGQQPQKIETKIIGLDKMADSFGKAMPMNYVISINQTPKEKTEGFYRLAIVKNRHGPTGVISELKVDYDRYKVSEVV